MRFLDQSVLTTAAVFGRDLRHRDVEVSTLVKPKIIDYEREEWRDV